MGERDYAVMPSGTAPVQEPITDVLIQARAALASARDRLDALLNQGVAASPSAMAPDSLSGTAFDVRTLANDVMTLVERVSARIGTSI